MPRTLPEAYGAPYNLPMRPILLPLLLLAACSKQPERTQNKTLTAADVTREATKLRLEPGQWETTTLITALGIPGHSAEQLKSATGTRTTTSHCITPEQAARPSADMLSGTKDGNCTYRRFSMDGARIDAAMRCEPAGTPGAVSMTLAGTHARDRFDLVMDMTIGMMGNAAMTMKATVAGRRTGVCTVPQETKI